VALGPRRPSKLCWTRSSIIGTDAAAQQTMQTSGARQPVNIIPSGPSLAHQTSQPATRQPAPPTHAQAASIRSRWPICARLPPVRLIRTVPFLSPTVHRSMDKLQKLQELQEHHQHDQSNASADPNPSIPPMTRSPFYSPLTAPR